MSKRKSSFMPDLEVLRSKKQVASEKLKALEASLKTVTEIDSIEIGSATERQLEVWIVVRYGLMVLLKLRSAMKLVPESLTDFQRMRKFEEVTGLQADEVSIILDFFGKFNYQDNVPMQPIYAPPVDACLECGSRLVANHSCSIRNYGTQGLCIGEKFTLRCQDCSLFYNYSQFGNKSDGFRYYPADLQQPAVEASDTVLFDRNLLEIQCCLAYVH